MAMKTWRMLAPVAWLVGLVLVAVLIGHRGPSAALAQRPWPTPPPAPIGSFPEVVPASQVTPVAAPVRPGSIALQIDPIFAGLIPRIPPRPSITVFSGESDPQDRVTLEFDAGSLDRTVQLTYETVPLDLAPATGPARVLLRAFKVQMYDHTGALTTPTFRYPVRMSVQARPQGIAVAGNDSGRLLLARFDEERGRWMPLLTTYDAGSGTLLVRILQPGIFGVVALPSPVAR